MAAHHTGLDQLSMDPISTADMRSELRSRQTALRSSLPHTHRIRDHLQSSLPVTAVKCPQPSKSQMPQSAPILPNLPIMLYLTTILTLRPLKSYHFCGALGPWLLPFCLSRFSPPISKKTPAFCISLIVSPSGSAVHSCSFSRHHLCVRPSKSSLSAPGLNSSHLGFQTTHLLCNTPAAS